MSRSAHSDGRPARHIAHVPQRTGGPPTTASPTCQRGDGGADGGDVPDPLVALPAPGRAPALEDHVQVAAADAAEVDRDEHVVGADGGHGDLLDVEPPRALQHRR